MKHCLLVATFSFLSAQLFAQSAGSLDPTFNQTGALYDTCCISSSGHMDVLVQADNKIVVATENNTNGLTYNADVVRYNWDGSRDAAFGDNGVVSLDSIHIVSKVLEQPDAKLLIGGNLNVQFPTSSLFDIARRKADGSPDSSFNGDGFVKINFWGSSESLRGMALQPDGKIVFTGQVYKPFPGQLNLVAVGRVTADGYLDTTFADNNTGWDTIRWSGWNSSGIDVDVLSNGKIMLMGISQSGVTGVPDTMVLMRLTANGLVDNTFGVNGIVRHVPNGGLAGGYKMAVQPDGKILVSGWGWNGVSTTRDMLVVRFNADGTLDANFGTNGEGYADFGLNEEAYDLAIQSDGKIVLVGEAVDNSLTYTYQLTRLNADGSVDATFGVNGSVVPIQNSQQTVFTAVALHPDNRIVATGFGIVGAQFAIMRFNAGTVGVNEIERLGGMDIYPNPNSGTFALTESMRVERVEVVNAQGQLVYTTIPEASVNAIQIDLPKRLGDGFYMLHVTTGNGTLQGKLMLQRR